MAEGSLVGVVIGGLIGIAGGVICPLLLEWRKGIVEKNKKRAEKLEEFVSALYEYDYWVYEQQSFILTERSREGTGKIKPIGKLRAIASIYFPQLSKEIDNLDEIAGQLNWWVLFVGRQMSKESKEQYEPEFMKRGAIYKTALNSVNDAITKIANTEFSSNN
jgi:hypothetical protein